MAVNNVGAGNTPSIYTLDVTKQYTKEEAKNVLASKGVTVDDSKLAETMTGAELSRIVGQYGSWQNDIATYFSQKANPAMSIDQAKAQLKQKYASGDISIKGDVNGSNAQTTILKQMEADGVITELGKNFNRTEIIEIINDVLPNLQIKNLDNGGYSVPWGHGEEAREVFNTLKEQLATATIDTPEIRALEEQLNQKTQQVNNNVRNIQILANQANNLAADIEKLIDQAIQEVKEVEEQVKKEAKAAANKELNKYANSNGEMTYAQFQSNLEQALNAIDPSARLSSATSKMLEANSKMETLKGVVGQIGDLNKQNATLREEMGDINAKISELREIEKAKQEEPPTRTDPIGFVLADGTKLDFFMDKDGDSLLSNEKEFLGATDGWNEMTALDTSGDGTVDYGELAAQQNLKVVVTKTDGTQEIKNIGDMFKQGDSINLNSFQAQNTKMDGTNNILAGKFSVNMDGQELNTGYQTLDTLDWLDGNYDFSDKTNGIGRFAQGVISALEGTEIQASEFDAIIQQLTAKLANNSIDASIAAMNETIKGERDAALAEGLRIKDGFEGTGNVDEPTGVDGTDTTDGVDEKDDLDWNDWNHTLELLKGAQSESKVNRYYKELTTQLKGKNYEAIDELKVRNKIRDSYAAAMHNLRYFGGKSETFVQELWAENETASETAMKGTGAEYEKHVLDVPSGTHKAPNTKEVEEEE